MPPTHPTTPTQVSKLRADVAEARAREQAARTEAEGLGQERADSLDRAEVREEERVLGLVLIRVWVCGGLCVCMCVFFVGGEEMVLVLLYNGLWAVFVRGGKCG
jgi:hypothetical protein